jgi:flavin reductase (DIM6/NTAB) family NADH-FMN oxidoreductase RutF
VLSEALAYLDCQVQQRMACGDHWLIYAVVNDGNVADQQAVTAVHHRKVGNHY